MRLLVLLACVRACVQARSTGRARNHVRLFGASTHTQITTHSAIERARARPLNCAYLRRSPVCVQQQKQQQHVAIVARPHTKHEIALTQTPRKLIPIYDYRARKLLLTLVVVLRQSSASQRRGKATTSSLLSLLPHDRRYARAAKSLLTVVSRARQTLCRRACKLLRD